MSSKNKDKGQCHPSNSEKGKYPFAVLNRPKEKGDNLYMYFAGKNQPVTSQPKAKGELSGEVLKSTPGQR